MQVQTNVFVHYSQSKIPYKAWKHFHYRYVKQTQLCWIVSCIRNQVFSECNPVSGSPQAGATVYSASCCSLLHTRRFGMVNDHYYKLHGYRYGRNEVPWPYWSTNSCLSEGVVTREYQEIARIPQRWLKCQKCPTGGFLLHFCGSVASGSILSRLKIWSMQLHLGMMSL